MKKYILSLMFILILCFSSFAQRNTIYDEAILVGEDVTYNFEYIDEELEETRYKHIATYHYRLYDDQDKELLFVPASKTHEIQTLRAGVIDDMSTRLSAIDKNDWEWIRADIIEFVDKDIGPETGLMGGR